MPPSIVHWTSPEYDYVVTRAARNNVLQTKAEGCDSVKMKRRNYDSGCAKRKQKAEKKRIADTLPKLTFHFLHLLLPQQPLLNLRQALHTHTHTHTHTVLLT